MLEAIPVASDTFLEVFIRCKGQLEVSALIGYRLVELLTLFARRREISISPANNSGRGRGRGRERGRGNKLFGTTPAAHYWKLLRFAF